MGWLARAYIILGNCTFRRVQGRSLVDCFVQLSCELLSTYRVIPRRHLVGVSGFAAERKFTAFYVWMECVALCFSVVHFGSPNCDFIASIRFSLSASAVDGLPILVAHSHR